MCFWFTNLPIIFPDPKDFIAYTEKISALGLAHIDVPLSRFHVCNLVKCVLTVSIAIENCLFSFPLKCQFNMAKIGFLHIHGWASAVVALSLKSQTKVGTLACFDFLLQNEKIKTSESTYLCLAFP